MTEAKLTRSVSEGERSAQRRMQIQRRLERPPSLTLRVRVLAPITNYGATPC